MKKLYMIITLFVSSFFLFNSKVNAYNFVTEFDLSLINEDFYFIKEASENFIKEDTTYSDDFIIYIYNNNLYVTFLNLDFSFIPYAYVSNDSTLGFLFDSSKNLDKFKYSSSLTKDGTISNFINKISYQYSNISNSIIFLYSNFDIPLKPTSGLVSTITYNYDYFTTISTADGTENFKTLYILNQEYQKYLGEYVDPHQEEIDKLESFYTVVIDRLGYLAKEMSSNYIYLSIFAIFVFIFVIELIRRRCI